MDELSPFSHLKVTLNLNWPLYLPFFIRVIMYHIHRLKETSASSLISARLRSTSLDP